MNKGKDCEEIFYAIKGKVYDLSIHKFASNIIERCLYFGTKEQKNNIINEIISKEDNFHDSIIYLMKDKFGNYVVQKMIENSDKDKRDEIVNRIINSPLLKKKEGYTKHVISYIEQLGYKINEDKKSQNKINNNINNNINISNNINNFSTANNINNISNANNINNNNVNNNRNNENNNNQINNNINSINDKDEKYKDDVYE